MNNDGRVKTVVTVILCIVLVGLLSLASYSEQKKNQELSAKFAETETAAGPYRSELEQRKRELAALQEELQYRPEKARLVVGFIPAESSDIGFIRQKAGEYELAPALILDCSKAMEQLEQLVRASDPAWDIVLYASGSTEKDYENIFTVKAYLQSIGREDVGLFLITTGNGYRPKRQQLLEDGFLGYTEYNDSPTSGQTQEGAVFMDYAYAKANADGFDSRVSDICFNRAATLFVFDMSLVHSGTLPEQTLALYLSTIAAYAGGETARLAGAAEVMNELSGINALMTECYAANAVSIQQLTARIEELESMIESIYSAAYQSKN